MEFYIYIVAISAGGVFGLLVLIALGCYINAKVKERRLRLQTEVMYSDPSLSKMDYDFSFYDEESAHMLSFARADGQLSIDDVLIDKTVLPPEEGIEEITGTYKPE